MLQSSGVQAQFGSGLGAYFSKGNNTTEDFFLGSRGLPGWAVGFSLLSTTMSSVTFLAYPATSYILDWRYKLPNACPVLK